MELPGKSLISGYHTGGEIDQRSAGAVWQAVGKAGDNLQELGVTGMKVAKDGREAAIPRAKVVAEATETPEARDARVMAKIREVDDRYQAGRLDSHYDSLAKEYEGKIAQNPDMTPEQVREGWVKLTQPTRDRYEADDTSPLAVRSRAHFENGDVNMQRTSGVAKTMRAKDDSFDKVRRAVADGDEAGLESGLSGIKDYLTEEQYEAARPEAYRGMRRNQVEKSIDGNPFVMRDELAKPEFLKNHPDLKDEDVRRLRMVAGETARRYDADGQASFLDALAKDEVKSVEEVESRFKDRVSPYLMEQMKGQYGQFQAVRERGLQRSPKFQAELQSKLDQDLANINDPEKYDMSHARAAFGLSQMNDGYLKVYYTEQLNAAREGREAVIQDQKMAAFQQVDRLADDFYPSDGIAEDGVMRMGSERAVNDGFLGDTMKLSTWFSDEQAVEIRNSGGNKARLQTFKKLWASRAKPSAKAADPVTQATADAILNGDDEVTWSTPESIRRAAERQANVAGMRVKLKTDLNEFLRINKNASQAEIHVELRRLLHNGDRTSKSDKLPDVPTLGNAPGNSLEPGPSITPGPNTQTNIR